jgi:hypothetical protein
LELVEEALVTIKIETLHESIFVLQEPGMLQALLCGRAQLWLGFKHPAEKH